MKISIVIPTINRYTDLLNTIRFLQNQDFSEFEILIIDQTEIRDDKVLEEVTKFESVRYFFYDGKSASAARNIGLREAKAEVVLFLDDDVIIEEVNFLHKHYRHYQDKSIHGVIGCPLEMQFDQKPRYSRHWMSTRNYEVGWLYFPSNYGCSTFANVGRSNNLSVRKSSAIEVGGMDENYEKGAHREEADFCLRLSKKYGPLLFDSMAQLVHIGNKSGGIRSWNDNAFVKAKHNFVGAIYFDLMMAPRKHFLEYHFTTLRYFLLNKTILIRPLLYPLVFYRLVSAYKKAISLYSKGPKYIN